jgi:hypothetical protein
VLLLKIFPEISVTRGDVNCLSLLTNLGRLLWCGETQIISSPIPFCLPATTNVICWTDGKGKKNPLLHKYDTNKKIVSLFGKQLKAVSSV